VQKMYFSIHAGEFENVNATAAEIYNLAVPYENLILNKTLKKVKDRTENGGLLMDPVKKCQIKVLFGPFTARRLIGRKE